MSNIFFTQGWEDYALLDSGNGRKLELFKNYIVNRPEPRAIWSKHLTEKVWNQADAIFKEEDNKRGGKWYVKNKLPEDFWICKYLDVQFIGSLASSGHIGYFPDKQTHWDLIRKFLQSQANNEANVLNLFAYTGVASLIAAKFDAKVYHVDSSTKAIMQGKYNQLISNFSDKKIHWMYDDVKKYVKRQVRRGNKYDLILLDPPRYGHGTSKEIWNLITDLPHLLEECRKLLLDKNSLLILTTYSPQLSHNDLGNLCSQYFVGDNVKITTGQLAIRENNLGRIIPQSEFCIVEYS